jgi:predicted DNA-binding protein (MmcQ/YjbR family)
MDLSEASIALKARLDAMPGATTDPVTARRGSDPIALMYKVMGKMFAIMSVRGAEYVVLKCDPHLAEVLRGHYAGIGHRTHLDPRHWIAVNLDADVPASEIGRLVEHSYELVRSGLTRKQKAELEALDKS